MASHLLLHGDMRTLGLLLAIVGVSFAVANAQDTDAPEGAIIESAEVSGLAIDRLSSALQRDIDALVGEGLSHERVAQLAAQIEAEAGNIALLVGQLGLFFILALFSASLARRTSGAAGEGGLLQNRIVDTGWASGVSLENISIEEDIAFIEGRAANEQSIEQFVQQLGEMRGLASVHVLSSSEEPGGDGEASAIRFTVSGHLD